MSRRRRAQKRTLLPDPKYKSLSIARFVNQIMISGKKSIAEKIVYGALDTVSEARSLKLDADKLAFFEDSLAKISPLVEVKSRRVGGATYQVPVEVRPDRRETLAARWLINAARKRKENDMVSRLAGELSDAVDGRGAAVKKREETHKMAEANKAFAHFRW